MLNLGGSTEKGENGTFAQSKMQFDSTGMFHWCPSRNLNDCLMDRQEAAMTVLQVKLLFNIKYIILIKSIILMCLNKIRDKNIMNHIIISGPCDSCRLCRRGQSFNWIKKLSNATSSIEYSLHSTSSSSFGGER